MHIYTPDPAENVEQEDELNHKKKLAPKVRKCCACRES
jgi:hypothetical protein